MITFAMLGAALVAALFFLPAHAIGRTLGILALGVGTYWAFSLGEYVSLKLTGSTDHGILITSTTLAAIGAIALARHLTVKGK